MYVNVSVSVCEYVCVSVCGCVCVQYFFDTNFR